MTTTTNPKIASFPLATRYSPEARALRVNELREQVRRGAYRLDAEAVARAILDSGAIEPSSIVATDASPETLRKAMARFVVLPSSDAGDTRHSAAV